MAKTQILNVVRATKEHARFMINNLYSEEIREIEAHGISVEFGVMFSFSRAQHCWVAEAPEGPVCMWGISPDSSLLGGAMAWMLTSTLLDKYAKDVIRRIRPFVEDLCEEYGSLEAYVDSRHTKSLRFFEWLGFKITPQGIPVGPNGIPFNKITRRAGYVR